MPEVQDKVPSRGAKFFDTRYSPVKFITTDDDRDFDKGSIVYIAGTNQVYGPYQLDSEIGRGNGQIHWKAFSLNTKANPVEKLSKAELEQRLSQLTAELEAIKHK